MELPPPDLPFPPSKDSKPCPVVGIPIAEVSRRVRETREKSQPDHQRDVDETAAAQSFIGLIREAFVYPLRPHYWLRLGLGVLVVLVISVAMAEPDGWVLGLGASGYMAAYYFDIIYHTANGLPGVPPWLDFHEAWADLVRPGWQMLVAAVFSAMPLGAVVWLYPEAGPWRGLLVGAGFVYMWLYFPMAILAIICHGNCEGSEWMALPHRVIPAVLRCLPGCLVCAGGFAVAQFIYVMSAKAAGPVIVLPWVCLVYVLMVQARLTGLIYVRYQDRLAW